MGKITDIVSQKKDPKRVNIFVDGEFAFGVSAEIQFEKKLKIGQILTEKQIDVLVELDQTERLFNKALGFLSFRPRSGKEIRDYLLRKGKLKEIDKSDVEKVQYEKSIEKAISKLKKLDLINDNEFAIWWVDQRKKFKLSGNRLIKLELMQKGISRDIIDDVLQGTNLTTLSEYELAEKAAKKKLSAYKKLEIREYRIKMGQYLSRRGFDWDITKKVVDTLSKKR